MQRQISRFRAGALLLPLVLAACGEGADPIQPGQVRPQFTGGIVGTSLKVTKTATGSWTKDVAYDWTLEKSVDPGGAELGKASSVTLNYTIQATRLAASNSESISVSGQICVQNVGGPATENLSIVDNVQASTNGGGTWSTIASVSVDVSAHPVIAGGATHCYPYTKGFTAVAGAVYRNEAAVTITNYSGSANAGDPATFEAYTAFTLPAAPVLSETDEAATLTDLLTCPAGFTCSASQGSWALTGSKTLSYAITVTNVSAPCDHTTSIVNAAKLTENDSGQQRTDDASVTVKTPECEPPTGFQGCTPGYWKQAQHFGSWVGYIPTGVNASLYNTVFGVNLFAANTTLLQALSTGGGGIYRLGRHSSAALLSAANSDVAYGMTPAQVIAAVQAAVASEEYDGAAGMFEKLNERNCPLGRNP